MTNGAEANRAVIERLYAAFDRHDGDTMAACYARDATFSDPVFPSLEGGEPGQMWRMFCAGGGDLSVTASEIRADEHAGSCRWVASYTFSTGRKVRNDIRAHFRFRDGLIVEHVDDFAFHAWASQAIGPIGRFLGWTPVLRAVVRRQAAARLARFQATDAGQPGPRA